jgi:hypothetical protein
MRRSQAPQQTELQLPYDINRRSEVLLQMVDKPKLAPPTTALVTEHESEGQNLFACPKTGPTISSFFARASFIMPPTCQE